MSVAKVEERVQARRGRPRQPSIDEAIVAAAVRLIAEKGYDGFSMAAVAERAGVAKTTIYRRWPTRSHLALATARSVMSRVVIVDSGDLRADLVGFARSLAAAYRSPGARQLVGELGLAAVLRPEVEDVFRRLAGTRLAPLREAIRRAAEAGLLRPATDPELMVDQIQGTLLYRLLHTGQGMSAISAEQLVDAVLQGALAP